MGRSVHPNNAPETTASPSSKRAQVRGVHYPDPPDRTGGRCAGDPRGSGRLLSARPHGEIAVCVDPSRDFFLTGL